MRKQPPVDARGVKLVITRRKEADVFASNELPEADRAVRGRAGLIGHHGDPAQRGLLDRSLAPASSPGRAAAQEATDGGVEGHSAEQCAEQSRQDDHHVAVEIAAIVGGAGFVHRRRGGDVGGVEQQAVVVMSHHWSFIFLQEMSRNREMIFHGKEMIFKAKHEEMD